MITAIIPTRFASSRFEGKPLALILKKPMIQWVYERAMASSILANVVVATDDKRIFDAVASFGGNAVKTSSQNRTGTDRVAEAAEKLELSWDDVVVNIQGDQPLIDPRSIDDVVRPFFENPVVEMSTLGFPIVNQREITDPKDVKVTFDAQGYALYFSRSRIPCPRDSDSIFQTYKHLGVYAYTRRFLEKFRKLPEGRLEQIEKLEQLRAIEHGYRIKVIVTRYDSPEVDLPEDILRIERHVTA
jgi:3-deoxy-manno-octulosonate cytidylyltransferase (CMP-KDO synthetase)